MLNPIGNHLDGKPFRLADRLFARRAVAHHPRQLKRLGDPATVLFAIKLNRKLHKDQFRTFLGLTLTRQLTYNRRQMTHGEISLPPDARQRIGAVRRGLPAQKLDRLAETLSIDRSFLLDVLGISERTVQRKHARSARLGVAASDRLSRIDRIYHLALEVFGDSPKAAEWLKRPNRALGKESPLKLLDTDAGTQQVERELRQLQYGFVY